MINPSPIGPENHLGKIDTVVTDGTNLFLDRVDVYVVAALIHVLIVAATCGLAVLIGGPLTAGFYVMGLKHVRGEPITKPATAIITVMLYLHLNNDPTHPLQLTSPTPDNHPDNRPIV